MRSFDGSTYDPKRDGERLGRQYDRVMNVMRDRKWHTLSEISRLARAPEASVSARLRDMRKSRFGGHRVTTYREENGRYLYRLIK